MRQRHASFSSGLRTRAAALAALLLAIALGYTLGRVDDSPLRAAPVDDTEDEESLLRIAPSSQKPQPTSLRSGEVLLLQVLQALSDATARSTLVVGGLDLDQKLVLDAVYPSLDPSQAARILAQVGLQLSEEVYRDEKVHWVQKKLERTRRRGSIVRRAPDADGDDQDDVNEDSSDVDSSHGSRESADRARHRTAGDREGSSLDAEQRARIDAIESDALRLYERRRGTRTHYLVQFETDSYDEAFEAMSLLEAIRSQEPAQRSTRRATPPAEDAPSSGVPPIRRR